MVTLTVPELYQKLMSLAGRATFATVTAKTVPKMRKTDNPFLGVQKINKVQGILNFNYEGSVRARLAREGKDPDSFEGGESWHVPIKVGGKWTPLAAHKKEPERVYLRFAREKTLQTAYFDFSKDPPVEVSADDIQPFLPTTKPYQNQGLDKTLNFLCYDLNNVVEINMDGENYVIQH